MNYLSRCSAAIFALSLIALSASATQAASVPMWGGGGGQNLSGMYSGSVTDSVLGTGTAVANLAQSGAWGGGALGGWFGFTFGSSTYSNPTSASTGGHGRGGHGDWGHHGGGSDIYGVFVSIIGSSACTFTYKASFTESSYQLNGEYAASNGCSGESGTFSLTQSCYYQEFGSLRRNTGSGSGPGVCS